MDDSWRYRLVLDGLRAEPVRPARELFEFYCQKMGVTGPGARAMFGMLINDLVLDELIVDFRETEPTDQSFPWTEIRLTGQGREWLNTIGLKQDD